MMKSVGYLRLKANNNSNAYPNLNICSFSLVLILNTIGLFVIKDSIGFVIIVRIEMTSEL